MIIKVARKQQQQQQRRRQQQQQQQPEVIKLVIVEQLATVPAKSPSLQVASHIPLFNNPPRRVTIKNNGVDSYLLRV